MRVSPWLLWVVVGTVLAAWLANFVAVLVFSRETVAEVDTAMLAVVGIVATAAHSIDKRKDNGDKGNDS